VRTIVTGVVRTGEAPALPKPTAALPPPKEPEAVARPLMSDEMVVELPQAPRPALEARAPNPNPPRPNLATPSFIIRGFPARRAGAEI